MAFGNDTRHFIDLNEIKHFLLSGVEELTNRALQYDEGSRVAIEALSGKSMLIQCGLPLTQQHFTFTIVFCEGALILTPDEENELDAIVKANSFFTVAKFFSGKFFGLGNRSGERPDDQKIVIEGDLDLVNELQDIISELDIDWEEPLSRITGDVVAHEISRAAHDAGRVIKKAGEFFERDLDDSLNRVADFLFKGRNFAGRDRFSSGLFNSRTRSQQRVNTATSDMNFEKELEEIQALQEAAEQRLEAFEKEQEKKRKATG